MSLAKDAGSTAAPLISQVQWVPFGGARSWLWHLASGTQLHEKTYDTSGRLVRYPLGGAIRDLTYDAADRITGYTHYDAATGTATEAATALNQTFGYDELGRLTSLTTASTSASIGYDANGNRSSVTLNGQTSTYTTAATSNRLTGTTNPARSFGHDSAGNTTSDSSSYTATYSLENRLASLTKAGVTTAYSYDVHGQRIRKAGSTGSSTTMIFVYDQGGQLLGEYDQNGQAIREYVWLGTTPIAVFTPNGTNPPTVYFIHADHLDAPRIVVDGTNQTRWRWLAEPFGNTLPETDPNGLGTFTLNLRFPGQYFDQESGLHYNYFRDYDASIGRYVQSDPIGLAGGINTYAYVGGNPLSYIDPNGQQATLGWCLGGPWGCAAGVAVAGWTIWMATPGGQEAVRTAATPSTVDHCCGQYRNVYDPNPKHGTAPRQGSRGGISPAPANGQVVLDMSVPAGEARIGYDSTTRQIVIFRNHYTDEQNCVKYWHGYVVSQEDLTPDQWRAGRDGGFPNWPRKPR